MTPKEQKAVNKCYKQLFGETLHQAMLNPIDIKEALEELNEAESSKSMDIDDTSWHTSPIANQRNKKNKY